MEKETMYWLFTTAPQAVAALVGIIFTGMFFMAESIDNRVKDDQSLLEIAQEAKTALYKNMQIVAVLAAITIIYDLLLTSIIPKLSNPDFCFTSWLVLGFAAINISTIYVTFKYVFQTVNPKCFDEIAANLSRKYLDGDVDKSEFIKHFIIFERSARNMPFVQQMDGRYMSIREIIRLLISHEIINRDEANELYEISKIRNLIVHGEPIEKVNRQIDDTLVNITNKVLDATQKGANN